MSFFFFFVEFELLTVVESQMLRASPYIKDGRKVLIK